MENNIIESCNTFSSCRIVVSCASINNALTCSVGKQISEVSRV